MLNLKYNISLLGQFLISIRNRQIPLICTDVILLIMFLTLNTLKYRICKDNYGFNLIVLFGPGSKKCMNVDMRIMRLAAVTEFARKNNTSELMFE